MITDRLRWTVQLSLPRLDIGPMSWWQTLPVLLAVFVVSTNVARVFAGPWPPQMNVDAAVFEHGGWYITQGAVPYVDFWDTKPPLTYWTTAVLALLVMGNMSALHILSVALACVSAVAVVGLVSTLVFDHTSDPLASAVAGVSVLALPAFHYTPALGFRPKYPAVALGLAAVLLWRYDRPLLAGASVAAAAGYMQHAAVFAAIVFAGTAARGRRHFVRAVGGAAVVTAAVVAPAVAVGATIPMVTEVVLAQLLVSEPTTIRSVAEKGGKGIVQMKYALVSLTLGGYGLLRNSVSRQLETWWVSVGGFLYSGILLFVDWDGADDILFVLVFLSIALGFLIAQLSSKRRTMVVSVVLLIVLISITVLGGAGVVFTPADTEETYDEDVLSTRTLYGVRAALFGTTTAKSPEPPTVNSPYYRPGEMEPVLNRFYWGEIKPHYCHYRFSAAEVRWLDRTNRSPTAVTCGQWPL